MELVNKEIDCDNFSSGRDERGGPGAWKYTNIKFPTCGYELGLEEACLAWLPKTPRLLRATSCMYEISLSSPYWISYPDPDTESHLHQLDIKSLLDTLLPRALFVPPLSFLNSFHSAERFNLFLREENKTVLRCRFISGQYGEAERKKEIAFCLVLFWELLYANEWLRHISLFLMPNGCAKVVPRKCL